MAGHSIFIGYRRDDTADVSGRVYDRLRGAFGEEAIFKDVDNMPVGIDFPTHVLSILPKCRIFLAMIGPGWLGVRDEQGERRLDDPADWVRIEIERALSTGIQIVPVLVNGAPMPSSEQLPESLRSLTRLNAAFVRRDPDFHKDMDKLIAALRAGESTGRVEVEAPAQGLAGSAAAWKLIETSLDVEDFIDFERLFPGTTELIQAARCRRQLQAWAEVSKSDPDAVARFQRTPVFPALEAEVARAAERAKSERQKNLAERLMQEEARKRAADESKAVKARQEAEELARLAAPHYQVVIHRVGPRRDLIVWATSNFADLRKEDVERMMDNLPAVFAVNLSRTDAHALVSRLAFVGTQAVAVLPGIS